MTLDEETDEDNSQLGFLERLTLALIMGASSLEESLQQTIGRYVLACQRSDGGWAGREGESDLYYTGFGLRSLAVLGLLEGEVAARAHQFLLGKMKTHQGWVDLLSWVYSDQLIEAAGGPSCLTGLGGEWRDRFIGLLQTLRRPDGGFAKSAEGLASSTYQTFLAIICLELLRLDFPDAEQAAQFLMGQRQSDGGFLEIRVAKRSGANPTAAAIVGLRCLDRCDTTTADTAAKFLIELQSDEGGFQANTRMPMADVLSTFTALSTLSELTTLLDWDPMMELDPAEIEKYVMTMHRAGGGFAGFDLDPAFDVEYTFYGLGVLSLCQLMKQSPNA